MIILIECYVFLAGVVLGSFYNVVGLRLAKGESIVSPPSHCPSCGRQLRYQELIPVFSYLALKGRCKGCGIKISWIYPVVEMCSGLLFLAVFLFSDDLQQMIMGWLLISLLIIIFISDISEMVFPDRVLIFFMVLFIAYRIFNPMDPWWDSLTGFAAGFIMLYVIALLSKGGMGGGDIKLFGVMGIILGFKGIICAFLLSAIYGTIIGGLGLISGKINRGQPVPFGPFIVLGTLSAYFFGDFIITWYIKLLT